jgi:hypothetical protein
VDGDNLFVLCSGLSINLNQGKHGATKRKAEMKELGSDRNSCGPTFGSAPLAASTRSVSELVRHLARIAAERDYAREREADQ